MKTKPGRRLPMLIVYGPIASLIFVVPLLADEPKNAAANQKAATPEPAGTLQGVTLSYEPTTTTRVLLATVGQSDSRMGVDLAAVNELLRSHLGLGEGKGLVVTSVGEDSPAAKAGIQKNDVLITVSGEEVAGLETFQKALEAAGDKPVSIGYIRAGKQQSVEVTPRPTTAALALAALAGSTVRTIGETKYWLGLGLAGADDTLRSQLSLPAGEGLVVTNVESDSPAGKAGVMVNDLLLKLDGKSLTTIEALTEQLQAIADKSATLELLRRGKPATLTVTPEKRANTWEAVHLFETTPRYQNLIFSAPQVHDLQDFTIQFGQAINLTYDQAKPNLIKQLSDLEAQVKQLEASLAALRTAIETPAQPAPSGEEKK